MRNILYCVQWTSRSLNCKWSRGRLALPLPPLQLRRLASSTICPAVLRPHLLHLLVPPCRARGFRLRLTQTPNHEQLLLYGTLENVTRCYSAMAAGNSNNTSIKHLFYIILIPLINSFQI